MKKFLKVDLRYKWLLINLVFGTFFMIAPYIYMVSPDQQVLTLKGMLCWFGLNQAFFGIGGFMEEERMDGTFTNLFLYPVQFRQYFIAKALQIGIESYLISLLQIFFFSLCNVHIPDLLHFIVILLINDIITANMGILFLGFTLKFRKLGSVNALVQQIIGFFSGYSTDIKRYPQIIEFVSYVIPLTYTISLARNNTFTIQPLWLLIPAILLFGNLEISGIHSKTEYIQYMLFSLILWQFVENMWSAVFEIRRKLKEGNFEYMMNMPLKGIHYVFGWAVSGVVSIVFEMIPLIVIFLLASLHLLTVKNILSFLGIALIMAFGTYGFAEILMGFAIYFKEADQFISLIANIAPFLGGLYFPVIQLAAPFLAISLLFPFTWGLDLVRNLLFGSSLILPLHYEIIAFVIVNILYTFAGTKIYDAMMKKARKNGLSKF